MIANNTGHKRKIIKRCKLQITAEFFEDIMDLGEETYISSVDYDPSRRIITFHVIGDGFLCPEGCEEPTIQFDDEIYHDTKVALKIAKKQ